ncbi:MAG TPA: DUF805 domain-containing protein [Allosphingosinicella sp.]|jgi:uncharacterized membrane protein YhaH (DUF805 family)
MHRDEPETAFGYMVQPLKRYADFSGRSRRKEYWLFYLLQILIYCAAAVPAVLLAVSSDPNSDPADSSEMIGVLAIFGLVFLALLIPSIAVTVRRFHDQDKTGWLYLLTFIPYVGGIIVFVMMLFEGTRGPNQYGPDPKDPDYVGDVFA